VLLAEAEGEVRRRVQTVERQAECDRMIPKYEGALAALMER
jgi:hypothetical protein